MRPFEKKSLLEIADRYKGEFRNAQPFPHVVIDNFLPEDLAEAAWGAFPSPDQMEGATYQTYENKIALRPDHPNCPGEIEILLNALNSSKFISFCEELTGIDKLVPDPHFTGAGMHQVSNRGKLGIHADFNFHEGLGLYRRLNVLIYLNKDWKEEYGGHFELWEKDMSQCARRVLPIFNRCVVFETSKDSWHGHPDPLDVPPGVTRKLLALYYYTSAQGSQVVQPHWTRHRERPGVGRDSYKRKLEKFFYAVTPPIGHRPIRILFNHPLSRLKVYLERRRSVKLPKG